MTRADWAYVAGLFEGEGSVNARRHIAQIGMCDREPLERVQTIAGGKLYGPYWRNDGRKRPMWEWRLVGYDAVLLLRGNIEEWLSPRRLAQFERVAEAPHLGKGGAQRAKTHCPKGHPYDEENTYRHKRGRGCRRCRRDQKGQKS